VSVQTCLEANNFVSGLSLDKAAVRGTDHPLTSSAEVVNGLSPPFLYASIHVTW